MPSKVLRVTTTPDPVLNNLFGRLRLLITARRNAYSNQRRVALQIEINRTIAAIRRYKLQQMKRRRNEVIIYPNKRVKTSVTTVRAPLQTYGYRPNSVEKKVYDIANTATSVSTTGSITLLFLPALGSDMNNRIGRKTLIKSIYLRGYINLDAAQSGVSVPIDSDAQMGRVMLVWDTQPNGAAPTITDILSTATPQSHLNINYRDRFKILMDKEFVFDAFYTINTASQALALSNRNIHAIKKYKKVNLETIFNATNGGTIADISSGALFLVTVGSVASGTNDITLNWTSRVRFTDQ